MKLNRILGMVFCVGVCCYSSMVSAGQTLTRDMLLKSSARFMPDIVLAELDVENARNRKLQAAGHFDASIEQKAGGYADGYYDGRQVDTRLVKPLPFMGSTVYGGYRHSEGIYPVYEDEYVTNNGGEFFFGAKVALLRNRSIDKGRAALADADLLIEQARANKLATQLRVQQDALNAYWFWVFTGHRVDVYEEMLQLAKTRQKKLKQRVKKGDLADIYLTENKQYILSRQSSLESALQRYRYAVQQLSFYWRDSEGSLVEPKREQLPKIIPTVSDRDVAMEIEEARLLQRPEMRFLLQEMQRQEIKQELGENAFLPKLDLDVRVANDNGEGSDRRDEAEMKMMLNISIPLQQRRARGQVAEASTSLKKLQLKQQKQLDQFTIKLNAIHTELLTALDLVKFAEQETELATKMQEAEEMRFQNGDSDFFTLNAREETLAKTRIRYLNAKENFYKAKTGLYAILADVEQLGIETVKSD